MKSIQNNAFLPFVLRIYRTSIVVGLFFMLATLAVLFGMAFFDWWRYEYLALAWIYERGGFPCIGIFSITAASYVVTHLLPTRFFAALLLVTVCTTGSWVIGGEMDWIPRMFKSGEAIQWLRIPFLMWLLIPPWIPAVIVTVYRSIFPAPINHTPNAAV